LIYGSFVSSLDGRIAVIGPERENSNPLDGLSNPVDFRLFQELHAQADCLITHGGYLRALAQRKLGNMLQVRAPDLVKWRLRNGLSAQPALIVASSTLRFALDPSIAQHGQPLHIATGRKADRTRIDALHHEGRQIIFAGDDHMVAGAPLAEVLGTLGYRTAYLLAGPKMLDTMLRDAKLSRLYLTLRHRLLGGERFHTMLEGSPLGQAGLLRLKTLYLDANAETPDQQLFAQFECNVSE
jgi:riboflavin biosynthesis pyrimidine reductase